MADPIPTDEFSICLVVDETAAEKVLALRQLLPTSVFRDDPPHVTLISNITAPTSLSDEQLIHEVTRIVEPMRYLPLKLRTKRVKNLPSHKYTPTSLVTLAASPSLLALRKDTIDRLQTAGYSVDTLQKLVYVPHMTLRLATKIQGETLQKANELFPQGSTITMGDWFVLRLIKDSKPRNMYPVKSSAS